MPGVCLLSPYSQPFHHGLGFCTQLLGNASIWNTFGLIQTTINIGNCLVPSCGKNAP